ncbi:hypothetical protein ABLS14_32300 [Pseudomonas aeruginosa]|uniref:hypothetical protein n=2 Tax=Pseudomonas aeruginosa TaxID=287 RepID=UPI0032B3CAEA
MNKANECTCPSGDGSLVHPCPAHPAVDQAGGDERDFQAEGAQEVPSPVSQEYDRHLISLLRKGEALPGHQEEAADEIERLRDWNDHLNNTVLPNILNPNFLMLMKGGERLLDLCTKDGKFIGVSLNDMKDVFDWMVTHARIAPDHAALAQPSPASDLDPLNLAPHAEAFNEAPAEALKPEPAEADRPEVVAWQYRVTAGPQTGWSLWHPGKGEEFERSYTVERRPLMTVAQYDRIVGELRAVIAQLRQHKNDYMDSGQETYRALQNEIREREAEIARLDGLVSGRTAERDAALARVASLESKLAELEKQDLVDVPGPDEIHQMAFEEGQPADDGDGYLFSAEEFDLFVQRLLDSCAAPVAQAQHSVPETTNEEANSFLRVADAGQFKDNAVAVRTAAVIIRSLLHRPALMQSIIRHRIGLTPEYEGQWHADLYGEDGEVQHHAEADTPDEAVRAVVALAAAPSQAQHSVPEGWVQSLPLKDHQPCKPNEDRANGYTIPIYSRPVLVEEALRKLRAVLCDPIGNVVIDGSDGDREEVQRALGMLAAAPGKEVPQAWLDVQAERRRQITTEGWTPEHDDLYCAAELPRAAAAYILNGANDEAPAIWPFSAKWWKPRDARSNYMRAGALILAEIERLDRAAAAGKEVGHE